MLLVSLVAAERRMRDAPKRMATLDDETEEHGFDDERTKADRAGARWILRVEGAPSSPASLVFESPIIVGREPGCDLVLKHATVAGRHLRFVPALGSVIVQELDTTDGFHINAARHETQALAHHGENIRIGAVTLMLALVDRDAK